jgi:LPS-assembly lipoprotein
MWLLRSLTVFACLLLSGCSSYRPLYGRATDGTSVTAALSAISVNEQRTRAGQLVRNNVLGGSNTDGASRFELRMVPTETTTAISDLAGTHTRRIRYGLSVAYELVELSSGTLLNRGTSFSNVPYDIVREPVADLQAANNARDRAAVEVGQDLRLRLAAFLSTRTN